MNLYEKMNNKYKVFFFVTLLFLVAGVFFVHSQTDKDKQSSNSQVGKDKQNFESEYLKYASELDPSKRIGPLENLLKRANKHEQFLMLPKVAKTAVEIKNYSKAKKYADELLVLAKEFSDDLDYGDAIHDANIVLGMVALGNNQIEDAKKFLLKAGNTKGSPQLSTYGPNMMLARALLERGEKNVVIEYLGLLKNVWEDNDGRLDSWIAAIRGGGEPYFGNNLLY
jgi:hypothetical protein